MATLTREELLRRKKQQEELLATGSVTGINKKPVMPVVQAPVSTPVVTPVVTPTPVVETPKPVVDNRPQDVIDAEKRQSMTVEQRNAIEFEKQYGRKPDPLYGTVGGIEQIDIERQKELDALAQDKLDRELKAQQELNRQNLAKSRDVAGANKAAFQSQLVAAPGQLTASTGTGLIAGIDAAQQQVIGNLSTQIANFDENAKNLQRQIDIAKERNEYKLVESLQRTKDTVDAAKVKAEADKRTAEITATKESFNLVQKQAENNQKALENISKFSPVVLEGITADDVTSMFTSFNGKIDPLMAEGLAAKFNKVGAMENSKNAEEKIKGQLERQKLMVDIHNAQKTEASKAIEGVQAIDAAIASGEMSQATGDALKVKLGYTEKGLDPTERALKEAQTKEILSKINPGAVDRGINVGEVGTGEALNLGTLGDPSQVKRTDRHNNPIANKAYPTAIQKLRESGLVQGEDFQVGETTQGIDTDGVPTIMYKDVATGIKGSIATLKAGQIGSWYANNNYGGSNQVIARLSQLSGQKVTNGNAQAIFNTLDTAAQTEVVKTIYSHEGGNQLFTDQKGYTDSQKAVMSGIDLSKPVTSTTLKVLSGAGLTANDLYSYQATEKKLVTPDQKEQMTSVMDLIRELKTHEGKSGAVGASLQKILPGVNEEDGFIAGTAAETYRVKFNTFIDTLALGNLDKLKGPMSDKDIAFLKNTATDMKLSMKEKDFVESLNKIEKKFQEKLDLPEQKELKKVTEKTEWDKYKKVVDKLVAEGIAEGDIEAKLVQLGIDPSSFFKPE